MTEEAEVIRRVTGGDVDAFRFLVERYQGPIICTIGNMISDVHRREDIAQDVFLTAFSQLHCFDPRRSKFSTWLFTIARNKSLNALKKKAPTPAGDLPPQPWRRTPPDELAEKELLKQLDRALEELPPAQKAVFVMAEFAGLSYEEIAAIEGIKTGTVRSRISRARDNLRLLLREYAGGEI